MEIKEQNGIKLIDKVIKDASLWGTYKVNANKGAPAQIVCQCTDIEANMRKYYQSLKKKL